MTRYLSTSFVFRAPILPLVCMLVLSAAALVRPAAAQISSVDRDRALVMLSEIKGSIKGEYYDPAFHGVDLDARFKEAGEMVKKATSLGQAFGIIAQAVLSLNDSHTFFVPPMQTVNADYGWDMRAVGDICYVSAVKPGSDAEAKGVHPGDVVLSLNGVPPTREELWKIDYLYHTLRPQPGMNVLLQSPDGKRREMTLLSKIQNSKRTIDATFDIEIDNANRESERGSQVRKHRWVNIADAFVWKMPAFNLTESAVDDMMSKARQQKTLILDLRGNGGGSEVTMLRLLGNLFDKDVTIGTLKRRKETKPLVAKTVGQKAFKGTVIVLIDSGSASAAEIVARVVQLEKRGTVIGDRSSGAVMASKSHSYQMGRDTAVFYWASITDADFLMTDGKSLEHAGVTPDILILPTGLDMSKNLDPALLYAAGMVDIKLDAAKAGAFFPIEWR